MQDLVGVASIRKLIEEVIDERSKLGAKREWRGLEDRERFGETMSNPLNQAAVAGQSEMLFNLEELFTYHAPDLQQRVQYSAIRSAAKYFAQVILDNTPRGADQTVAIRKLRE